MEKLIFNKIVDANGRVAYEFIHVPMLWLNFSGREGRYNPEGKRNFNILLPQDVADQARRLEEYGVILQPSNAKAALLAGLIVS